MVGACARKLTLPPEPYLLINNNKKTICDHIMAWHIGQWHGAIFSATGATHLCESSDSLTKHKKGQPRIS
jgi:hypothetical protein